MQTLLHTLEQNYVIITENIGDSVFLTYVKVKKCKTLIAKHFLEQG